MRAKRWRGNRPTAESLAALATQVAGYPSKGVGGSLIPQATWNGLGECPAGWTAPVVAVASESDPGRWDCDVSGKDMALLQDDAVLDVRTDPPGKAMVQARRGEFTNLDGTPSETSVAPISSVVRVVK